MPMTKKKILILGASGMAGHVVYTYLQETGIYNVLGTVYRRKLSEENIILDVRDVDQLEQVFKAEQPDYVINCVGALVRESKEDPANSVLLNAYLPRFIAGKLSDTQTRLIHISTDCVFSGKRGDYTEQDLPDAQDVYGRGKALGEIINDKDLTLRTSIIGPEIKENGEGLFHWYMSQSDIVKGFSKVFWGGVTTLELAKVIHKVIQQGVTGLLQITNNEKISKYELLKLFREIYRTDLQEIKAFEDYQVDKSLKSDKILSVHKVPQYDYMFREMYEFIIAHPYLYSFYTNLSYFKK